LLSYEAQMREYCDSEKLRSKVLNCRGYSPVESDSKETANDKPRKIWREGLVVKECLQMISQILPWKTEENHEKTCQNG
jgi:hypothetical protein